METIRILFYNTMWGSPLHFRQEELPSGCSFTTDRKQLSTADAVVFHLPDLYQSMETEEIIKPEGQIWVAWCLECEENYFWINNEEFRSNFDLWMGYHQEDDILYPYYDACYGALLPKAVLSASRKNKACMFISSTVDQSLRREYLNELMEHTEIDSYGNLFNNKELPEDKGVDTLLKVASGYKFMIGFENAIAKDYITEKFYNPILAGSVPVYRGAPNVREFMPGKDCFLDASDFSSPKELAHYMNECYNDENLYNHFFEWKKAPLLPSFTEKLNRIQTNPFTRLCLKIRELKTILPSVP